MLVKSGHSNYKNIYLILEKQYIKELRMNQKNIIIILILLLAGCASTPKRLDTEKEMLADSGELTSHELEKSAQNLSAFIIEYFKSHPDKNGVFVALLPTKNDTSEQIPTKDFDNTLVNELRKGNIYTVLTETRSQSLAEIEFSMTGLTEKPMSIGELKSPNYFIKTDITESMYRHKGNKIIEQTINIELVKVTTSIAVWGEKVKFRKRAASSGGVGW